MVYSYRPRYEMNYIMLPTLVRIGVEHAARLYSSSYAELVRCFVNKMSRAPFSECGSNRGLSTTSAGGACSACGLCYCSPCCTYDMIPPMHPLPRWT
eukprot:8260784-Pyramimonas_sp.AAC.2